MFQERAFLLSEEIINYYLNDTSSWFYECIGDLTDKGDKNIKFDKDKKYISLALGSDLGFKVLVSYKELKDTVESNERLFYIYENTSFTHTISHNAGFNIGEGSYVSANHCQKGSDYKVYKIEAYSSTPPRKSLTRRKTIPSKTKSKKSPKRTTKKRYNTI
jgi:hypothetical protein